MAALGRFNGKDFCFCPKHNCKSCAKCGHKVQGPATMGAAHTMVNGVPVLRIGDQGVHDKQTCCGPNKWVAMKTITPHKVFVEGKEVFCVGDISLHDGKDQGKLMVGATNVFVGS
jgi:hypothetical protein